MKKIDYSSHIQEDKEELKKLLKTDLCPKLKERCEILYWLKSGEVSTMKEAMVLKNRSLVHGSNLWKLYKEKGLSEYLKLNYKLRKSPLLGKESLENHLKTKGFSTINEARLWVLNISEWHDKFQSLANIVIV